MASPNTVLKWPLANFFKFLIDFEFNALPPIYVWPRYIFPHKIHNRKFNTADFSGKHDIDHGCNKEHATRIMNIRIAQCISKCIYLKDVLHV